MAKDIMVTTGLCAFKIAIRDRQNATWQGIVTRLDTGESVSFRSEMELMKLIESVQASPD